MKYKDYLIIPIIVMYIVLTSFAFMGNGGNIYGNPDVPTASISPEDINLSDDIWYADGSRNNDCIYAGNVKKISVDDMHLLCATSEGKNYDLIFLNSMTAYDCISGTYYARADYSTMITDLQSGKFINSEYYEDYYVFDQNGKSAEFFGDKVYKGTWEVNTSDSLLVYDKTCKGYIGFEILYDSYGNITGISNDDYVYNLVT